MSVLQRCAKCDATTGAGVPPADDLHSEPEVAPGSRYHTLLNSNEPPGTSDLTSIRSLVSKTGARLTCLDSEIARLRDRVKALEDERELLSQSHARNCAILSPLRRIPPEVLAEIFSWTLPSAGDLLNSGFLLHWKEAPWMLTHICGRWRTVALSTPSLWSLVFIDFQDQSFSPNPLRTVLETQIARANKLKIHFYGAENKNDVLQVEMLELLAEHSFRWEEFHVSLTSFLLPVVATLRDRLPALRRLGVNWDTAESQGSVVDCFENSPALIEAHAYNEFSPVSIPLPMHQLKRYQRDGPWEMHRDALALGSNLVQARIEIDYNHSWPVSDDSIELLHLRRLYVSQTTVLDYIRAPALDELAFCVEEGYASSDILCHVQPFILRSSSNLRRLCLSGTPDARFTTEILEKFPSLTELVIILIDLEDDLRGLELAANTLIIELTTLKPNGKAAISPQLSTIYFGCEDETYFDYSLYLKMLQSRWHSGGGALKSAALFIASGPSPDPATLAGLDFLRRQGLDVLLLEGRDGSDLIDIVSFCLLWD
ncbi:hypothetical protein C8R43DRAFT_1237164 [Mycena crocata]|nr:hypothetical protein C8R43DRAFT_1237164 [Mycena crocata]